MPPSSLSRRGVLRLLPATLLPACGGPAKASDEDAVALRLADYPGLAEPGGSAVVSLPDKLLEVVIVHRPEGDFRAIWRICTHGACTVEYQADRRELVCPCHGSRFDETGAVVEGPARRGLRPFAVSRVADRLFIGRGPGV